jgi:hypothetical protein
MMSTVKILIKRNRAKETSLHVILEGKKKGNMMTLNDVHS